MHSALALCINTKWTQYFQANSAGVNAACALVDESLNELDPEVAEYLKAKNLSADLYAQSWLLSLGVSLLPAVEAVNLLDFLFSQGLHWTVPSIAAVVMSKRGILLTSENPSHVLQSLQAARAKVFSPPSLSVIHGFGIFAGPPYGHDDFVCTSFSSCPHFLCVPHPVHISMSLFSLEFLFHFSYMLLQSLPVIHQEVAAGAERAWTRLTQNLRERIITHTRRVG
jgi:hypothetical protein